MVCGFRLVANNEWTFGEYSYFAYFPIIYYLRNYLTSFETFHSAEICMIGQRRLVFSQTFTGLGAGMVCMGLMVGVQASCNRHSDVAISIGLLTTFNAVGGVTAKAMKGLMQTYLLSLLPAGSSQEDFVRALNGHWSVMLLVAVGATAFAIVMAGVGLSGVSLSSRVCVSMAESGGWWSGQSGKFTDLFPHGIGNSIIWTKSSSTCLELYLELMMPSVKILMGDI